VFIALLVIGCMAPAKSADSAASDDAEARDYCTGHGGMLVDRVATWNTNPDARLDLAGRIATGAVRGADFSPIMRYQPGDQLPDMFERVRP
jgi:hypothetical protein